MGRNNFDSPILPGPGAEVTIQPALPRMALHFGQPVLILAFVVVPGYLSRYNGDPREPEVCAVIQARNGLLRSVSVDSLTVEDLTLTAQP